MLSTIKLNSNALIHNLNLFKKRCENVAPVLKANAYGHGIEEIYSIIKDQDFEKICVNYFSEVKQLRNLGYTGKVLVIGPVYGDDLSQAVKTNCEFIVGNQALLHKWLQQQTKAKIHIKINTGMSRQGFDLDDTAQIIAQLSSVKTKVVGICTHLSDTEDTKISQHTESQLALFNKALKQFTTNGFSLETHAAASSAAINTPAAVFDFVRIGISLYGLWPSLSLKKQYTKSFDLKPALSWTSFISSIRTIHKGEPVSYGCNFIAPHTMKVATIPVGYYEGYPRLASNFTSDKKEPSYVIVGNKKCPILGNICMNMMVISLESLINVNQLDEVILIGEKNKLSVSVDDIANWTDTINYEITTRINPLIQRVVV